MDNQDDGTRIYNVLEIRDLSIIADIKATNPLGNHASDRDFHIYLLSGKRDF